DGKIVRTGGIELAEALEEKGYEWIEQELFHDTDDATSAEAAQA
ncbi:MAG TPA: ABC transporter ATP-binding protein, partial [Microbacterium sp.]|nr:ABC transporter ATP-binding protein [Microbacterium sp.]